MQKRTELGLLLVKKQSCAEDLDDFCSEVLNQFPGFLGSPHPLCSVLTATSVPTPQHIPTSEPPLHSIIHWPDVQNFSGSRDVRWSKAFFRDPGIPSDCLRGEKIN